MADIHIEGLCKRFGDNTVLDGISMHIRSGEFVAVLGPSGCGKTTLLRLVAGFESPDAGTIALGDRIVSSQSIDVPAEKRGIGIVFQNYALWPHMSVADNVGYSLKIGGMAGGERERRVREVLATVNLADFAGRRPADLSGGQRQRVALARCLAANSSVVLLDEPLANLDVHLRAAMEEEFSRFHAASRATMFYITHDQAEAMALADRIAVMDKGRLIQFARPEELYREPASEMVASFIGEGFIVPAEDMVPRAPGYAVASIFGTRMELRCGRSERSRAGALLSLHPQDLRLAGANENGIPARVTRMSYRGGYMRTDVVCEASPSTRLCLNIPEPAGVTVGQAVQIAITDGWVIPDRAA